MPNKTELVKIALYGGPMDGHETAVASGTVQIQARNGKDSAPTLYSYSAEWTKHFNETDAAFKKAVFIPKDFPGRPPQPMAA